jgi:hypothetical protein
MADHRKPPKGKTNKEIHEKAKKYQFEDFVLSFEKCRKKWAALPNRASPPRELVERTFYMLNAVLQVYTREGNWHEGKPKEHIPAHIASIISQNIAYLIAGKIPGPIECILRTGTPGVGPQENLHRGYAVAYMKACEAGHYHDRTPRITVCTFYGITPRAATEWKNTHLKLSITEPEHFFPDAKDPKERATLLRQAVEEFGPAYAQHAHGSVARKSKQGASGKR